MSDFEVCEEWGCCYIGRPECDGMNCKIDHTYLASILRASITELEADLKEMCKLVSLGRFQPAGIDFNLEGVFECKYCLGETEFYFDNLTLKKRYEDHEDDCPWHKARAILERGKR